MNTAHKEVTLSKVSKLSGEVAEMRADLQAVAAAVFGMQGIFAELVQTLGGKMAEQGQQIQVMDANMGKILSGMVEHIEKLEEGIGKLGASVKDSTEPAPGQYQPDLDNLNKFEKTAVEAGIIINAVKSFKNRNNLDLKVAKDRVEFLAWKMGLFFPQPAQLQEFMNIDAKEEATQKHLHAMSLGCVSSLTYDKQTSKVQDYIQTLPPLTSTEVALLPGQFIECIKQYRWRTQLGLLLSKLRVEEARDVVLKKVVA